ncbi:MAG: heparan-alpha-glucosaminide N-acetyltransferase domain-containing protein, partial [Lutibacter sp.]|nr:heparan-alpha-glucosaminide N-acetyltransferase domain-containing protein [Lutibacter sp.]
MKTTRLDSLDVMRGLTIALMITVNNPGSWEYVYAPLRHSTWHGCTPTDLVFPFFLFIVGVSMSYSFAKFRSLLDTRVFKKITKRVVVIFLLGFLLNIFPFFDLENARIMGVLQRIALAYGLAALLCIRLNRKQLFFVLAVILLAYWGLLFLGGTHGMYTLDGNYPRLLDLKILGENHLYKGFGIPFDPEGLLGTLPAAGTVIMGYLTGGLIAKGVHTALKKMVFLGLGALLLGLIWHTIFPINKPLWTSSYVLYTGGFALLTLAGLCWLIDIKGYKKW